MQFAYLPEEGFFQLLLAAAFGTSVALVLDEFALVFYLNDVYLEEEGRKSVDAIVLGVAFGALFLLHAAPLGQDTDGPRWLLTVVLLIHLCIVVICALKGKVYLATFGVFMPLLAWIGAIRLAEPNSMWARRRYAPGSKRRLRSEERYTRYEARWRPRKERAWDLIGGETGRPDRGV